MATSNPFLVKTKPKGTKQFPRFDEIERQLVLMSSFYGLKLTQNTTKLNGRQLLQHSCTVAITLVYSGLNLAVYIYESHQGRANSFNTIVQLTVNVACLAMCSFPSTLFANHAAVKEILGWCREVYERSPIPEVAEIQLKVLEPMNKRTYKVLRLMQAAMIADMVWLTSGAIVMNFLVSEDVVIFPVPFYKTDGYMTRPEFFYPTWVLVSSVAAKTLFDACLSLNVYMVLIEHAVTHLSILSEILRNLGRITSGDDAVENTDVLKIFIGKHSNAMIKSKQLSDLFAIPILSHEMATICCFVLFGLTMFVNTSAWYYGLSASAIVLTYSFYSYFGQKLSDSAEAVFEAARETNWIEMTLKDRKLMLTVTMMAQRPLEIVSGGLEAVSFMRLTKIMKLGYNIMLTIVKTQM